MSDSDSDSDIIFFEEEVVQDFENDDPLPNILSLYSKNNNDIDKRIKWWSHKAKGIISKDFIDNLPVNNQVKQQPCIHLNRVLQDGTEHSDIEDPIMFWKQFNKANNIEKKDELYNPYIHNFVNYTSQNNQDVYVEHIKSVKRLLQGEHANRTGMLSTPFDRIDTVVRIDVDRYESDLQLFVVNDPISINGKQLAKVTYVDQEIITVENDDYELTYDKQNWMNNNFFLYSIDFPNKISKKDLLNKSVLAVGERAQNFVYISANDLISFDKDALIKDPLLVYANGVDRQILEQRYKKLIPKLLPTVICEQLNKDADSIINRITELDFLTTIASKNYKDIQINEIFKSADYQQSDKNPKPNFIFHLQDAVEGARNVLIVSLYTYVNKQKNGVHHFRLGPSCYFNVVKRKSGGWDIGDEYHMDQNVEIDIKTPNLEYFDDELLALIKLFKNKQYDYHPSVKKLKYVKKIRKNVNYQGKKDFSNLLPEQNVLRDQTIDEVDTELIEDPQMILILDNLQINKKALSPLDLAKLQRWFEEDRTQIKGINMVIFLMMLAQTYLPIILFDGINEKTIISYPDNNEFGLTIQRRLNNIMSSEVIASAYKMFSKQLPHYTRRINEVKAVYREKQDAFANDTVWKNFSKPKKGQKSNTVSKPKHIFGKATKIQEKTIYKIEAETSDDSHQHIMNLEALLNVMNERCVDLAKDPYFTALIHEGISDKTIGKISTMIDKRLANPSLLKPDMIASFIKNDIKPLYGKLVFGYKLKGDDEDFTSVIQEFVDDDNLQEIMLRNLNGYLNISVYDIEYDQRKLELAYILLYIVSLAIKDVDKTIQDFLINRFLLKAERSNKTAEMIKLAYEEEREQYKAKQMRALETMQPDERFLKKTLFDLGLEDKSTLVTKIDDKQEDFTVNDDDEELDIDD